MSRVNAAGFLAALGLSLAIGHGGAVARDLDVAVGKALFDRIWTIAGASNHASDGLGPLFNARSCSSCHAGGGAGKMPDIDGDPASSGLVLRLPAGSPYGRQLQTNAAPGLQPEGRLTVHWREDERTLADGTRVKLRAPTWRIDDPLFGLKPVEGSLRIAPSLAGLGQVEAELSSGGRPLFGLKGDQADLASQIGDALLLDLGLSSPQRPQPWGDCGEEAMHCRQTIQGSGLHDAGIELSAEVVRTLAAYVRSLPPPSSSAPDDPAGAVLFASTGCAACHQPSLGRLQAYSDFRTHDLGPALADPDPADPFRALWRTTPLWGLGSRIHHQAALLHDGRARNATEAILWHGGAAQAAVEKFSALSAVDRARLVAYLEGL